MIVIVAYLDDSLIIEKTMEGAIRARDTVLFLLKFRFHNKLGQVNPRGGVFGNDDKQCQDGNLVANRKGSKHLDPLSGHYPNKAAIPLAPMQIRALQQDLTKAQQKQLSYEQEISLSKDSLKDLQWLSLIHI